MRGWISVAALLVACGGSNGMTSGGDGGGGSGGGGDGGGGGSNVGACEVFPSDFIFNTAIASLPVDPNSAAYITTIGSGTKLHLDLGTETDQSKDDYYGIPWNTVAGNSLTWQTAKYFAADSGDYDWDAASESDCANASHGVVSPCVSVPVLLPIPQSPVVESGVNTTADQTPDDDHHMLIVDTDNCRLWELYHSYDTSGWDIFGSSTWDLTSDALRPDTWTSADAAGFPIFPLLLKASEASSGTINHALRFTMTSSNIRTAYNWPARHDTGNDSSNTSHPPMGQLFRLKASFQIPANYNTQAKAILTAMQTYGLYVADGGSNWYVTGEPSADWQDDTFDQVQSVAGSNFEAVDITAITSRTGFDPNSGRVPPP
jgi:hypothetical protein